MALIAQRQRSGAMQARRLKGQLRKGQSSVLCESSFSGDYNGYFDGLVTPRMIRMDEGLLFGKDWIERLFFYDAIGCQIDINSKWLADALINGGEELFRHLVFRNYHYISIDPVLLVDTVLSQREWGLAKQLETAINTTRDPSLCAQLRGNARLDELYEIAYLYCLRVDAEVANAG